MLLLPFVVSFFLYSIPYIVPAFCFLHLVALVPIMISSYTQPLRFKQGLLWGCAVLSVQLSWSLVMLIGYQFSITIACFWLLCILALSLYVGIWFVVQSYLQAHIGWFFSWCFSSLVFFSFMTYGCLFVFGVCEGYPLFNPCILWAYYPSLLQGVYYLHMGGMITWWIIIQLCIAGMIIDNRNRFRYFCIGSCILLFYGYLCFQSSHIEKSVLRNTACLAPTWWFTHKDPISSGYAMVHEVNQIVQKQPEVQFLCMSESCFNWNIHEYPQFLEIMSEDAPDVAIGLCCHQKKESGLASSFIILQHGAITFSYDKMHLIPFMERAVPGFETLLHNEAYFIYGDHNQNDIVMIQGKPFQVYICSEFLFETKKPKGVPILFLCNDAWLTVPFAKAWVPLFVTYFEKRYRVPVYYSTVCGTHNIGITP